MFLDALLYVGLILAAIGFLASSSVFLVWAILGPRDEPRIRRLRISQSSLVLFVAAVFSGASVFYLNVMPGTMQMVRPEFRPPYHACSDFLSILGPLFVLLSAGLVIGVFWQYFGSRRRALLTSLCCLVLFLFASSANYWLIYSIQVPAFDRYVAIESRDWLTHVGDAAPDFSVTMLDGSEVNRSGFRGKVVLLNFFATWCGPCMTELPHLEELWNDWGGNDDFAMLVVGREESQETVAKFQSENGYTFPMAIDPDRTAFGKFAVDGIPRTYVISRDGKILYQSMGFAEIDLYARELANLRQIISSELATQPGTQSVTLDELDQD